VSTAGHAERLERVVASGNWTQVPDETPLLRDPDDEPCSALTARASYLPVGKAPPASPTAYYDGEPAAEPAAVPLALSAGCVKFREKVFAQHLSLFV
jgi:hypothetical protein